jgi:hypothetical protein
MDIPNYVHFSLRASDFSKKKTVETEMVRDPKKYVSK